ncbi:7-cyano-7-deazaguanine synthase QueC [Legionella quinlivanii]|uniref:7-cyano-7-deazaguanine synthase n=1 Tax=Legionella quinlivanii TaxID=45073 RepID=A0A364LKW8_9GAMM|nr:7-cyano-7-deazaguanine synthase QueC [Legionella quinlivanii]RAP37365.1 7-cyano-7-deazaguanine synthase QueC [Legionella quinlivanii]
MRKAVVLLSGGLDSTTCLAVAKAAGYQCFALSFSYGQRHNSEIEAAKRVAACFKVAEHRIVNLDINQFGGSALTDETIEVPDYQPTDSIPLTYVPARNTIFLAIALGYAEVIGANDLFIGISSVDYSNYPDCRPEYMDAFKKMAGLATRAGVEGNPLEIHTPLIHLSKAETVRLGAGLGVDYALTVSCYQADEKGRACGRCDSCTFRQKGFVEAGIADPTLYQNN